MKLSPGDSITSSPKKLLWREEIRSKHIWVLQQREGSRGKRFTDNQIYSKRCKGLGFWNHSFDIHLSSGPVFLFLSLRAHWPALGSSCSHMTVTSFILSINSSPGGSILDSSEIPPQREKGDYQDITYKGERGGACSHTRILQKFAAGLVKVATSHRHQSSLKD